MIASLSQKSCCRIKSLSLLHAKNVSFYLTLKHLFKKNTMLTDDLNLEDWSVWDNSDSECDYEPGESKLMRLESATLSILQCPNCGSHILSGKLVFNM